MTQFVVLALALLAAGALVGLLAGLFGVGGGTVVVPILYEVFVWLGVPDDLRMPEPDVASLDLVRCQSIKHGVFNPHRFRLPKTLLQSGLTGRLERDAYSHALKSILNTLRVKARFKNDR